MKHPSKRILILATLTVFIAIGFVAYVVWRPASDGISDSNWQLEQTLSSDVNSESQPPETDGSKTPEDFQTGSSKAPTAALNTQKRLEQQLSLPLNVSMDQYKADLWARIQSDPPDLERLDEYELDAEMAYRLYMYFGNCSMVPHTDQQVDKRLGHLLERAERARNRDGFLDRLEGQANEVLDIYEICLHIPLEVDRRLEAVVWLTKAVQLGHEIAETQFYEKAMGFILRPDYFTNSPPLALQQPGLVSEFKSTARLGLSRALEKGYPEAYLAQSQAVLEGLIYPKDPLLAYAYARAAELEAARHRVMVRDIGERKSAAAQYLSKEELAEAEQLARELPLSHGG